MATRSQRADSLEYRSLIGPKPQRKIVAVWPRQRPVSRAANEFLKLISASGKTLRCSHDARSCEGLPELIDANERDEQGRGYNSITAFDR